MTAVANPLPDREENPPSRLGRPCPQDDGLSNPRPSRPCRRIVHHAVNGGSSMRVSTTICVASARGSSRDDLAFMPGAAHSSPIIERDSELRHASAPLARGCTCPARQVKPACPECDCMGAPHRHRTSKNEAISSTRASDMAPFPARMPASSAMSAIGRLQLGNASPQIGTVRLEPRLSIASCQFALQLRQFVIASRGQ